MKEKYGEEKKGDNLIFTHEKMSISRKTDIPHSVDFDGKLSTSYIKSLNMLKHP